MNFTEAVRPVVEALLIGFLVGAQREAAREETERQPGVRDFVLIALVGAISGLMGNPYLTVAALVSIAALLVAFHWKTSERSGVTTEMAAIATFSLGFLTASPGVAFGAQLAVAITIVIVLLLEAKRWLHQFIRRAITENEFADTVRFLALIFVVYPLLPEGRFGPYGAFSPRAIWLFIILVSSVSYVGYFLEKFLGSRIGLRLAGLLAGMASTTAATISFSRSASEEPKRRKLLTQAAILANAMQFPRVLVVLFVANAPLARTMLLPLLAMTVVGLAAGWVAGRGESPEARAEGVGLRNPFQLLPALKFGALFAVMSFLSKAAVAAFGTAGVTWVAALGGAVDVDAAILAVSGLAQGPALTLASAGLMVLVALLANAAFKAAVALYAGGAAFARGLMLSFVAVFLAGTAAWLAASNW